jgi:hypothetical protein
LLSGIVGAFVWLVASIPIGMAMAPFQSRMAQETLRNTTDLPPELRTILEQFAGAPAIGVGMILMFFVMLVICTLFGMLGGLFGALMFRKAQPVIPPPIPPNVF